MHLILVLIFSIENIMSQNIFIKQSLEDTEEFYPYSQHQNQSICSNKNEIQVFNNFKPLKEEWSYKINAPILSSIKIADINGDSIDDIIITTFDTSGTGYNNGFIHIFDINGERLPGWSLKISGSPIAASASIADLNNNGKNEIIVGSWANTYVFSNEGKILPGFPINLGTSNAPVVFDVNKDNYNEIIISSNKSLYIIDYQGTILDGWPFISNDYIGPPVVADINNDTHFEIVAGTFQPAVDSNSYQFYAWNLDGSVLDNFPVRTCGTVKSAPAIADIDKDEEMEIIFPAYHFSNQDSLYVIDSKGKNKPGWPTCIPYGRLSSPAIGDIDNDGYFEIVIGGLDASTFYNKEIVYAFNHNGTSLDNWPIIIENDSGSGNINSSPIIADIDGNPSNVEIIIKIFDHIVAFHNDGNIVNGFPLIIDDENHAGGKSPSPAISDMNNNGDLELIISSNYGHIKLIDLDEQYISDKLYWPMYKRNCINNSVINSLATKINKNIINNKSDNRLFIINPITNSNIKIRLYLNDECFYKLTIANLFNQKIKTMYNGYSSKGYTFLNFDIKNSNIASGVYFINLITNKTRTSKKFIILR